MNNKNTSWITSTQGLLTTFALTVILSSVILANAAHAETCSGINVSASYLNVRTGPGTNYYKTGTIQKNEKYVVSGKRGNWKSIWFDHKVRWIYAKKYTQPTTLSCGTVKNTPSLNVRSGPSTGYRRVGSMKRNSQWAVIGSKGSWKKVWYKSEVRWVHGSYLNTNTANNDAENDSSVSIGIRSFVINNGDGTTKSRYTTVSTSVSGTATYFQLSENNKFNGSKWVKFSNTAKYTLSSGNGTKRVYFRVKNNKGRISNTVSDTIKLSIPAAPSTIRNINKSVFYTEYRKQFGRLSSSQTTGLNYLLSNFEKDKEPLYSSLTTWSRQIAYLLATTKHEVANTYKPITEYSNTTCRRYNGGCTYKGRGYVQLTHKYNYEKMSKITGVNLVAKPTLALNPNTAYRVMSYGMFHGSFTGRKLGRYVKTGKTDYYNARRVVNGLDRATLIKGYATKFQKILSRSAS